MAEVEVDVVEIEIEGAGSDSDIEMISDTANSTPTDDGKEKKQRSDLWSHFSRVTVGDTIYANCKYCKTKYKISGKGNSSTGNFNRHMKSKHLAILNSEKIKKGQMNIDAILSKREHGIMTFSNDEYRQKLLRWIVLSDQPHTEVECQSFRELIAYLNSAVVNITADTVKNQLMRTFTEAVNGQKRIINEIPGKVSFTHDGWTSPNQIPFLGIKCHWISQNWETKEFLLDFPLLMSQHTGANICDVFRGTLDKFDIKFEKFFGITTDNASNNDTFFEEFKRASLENGVEFDISERRVRCTAHVLNLAVQAMLSYIKVLPKKTEQEREGFPDDDDVNDMEGSDQIVEAKAVARLRKVIRMIRASPQRRQRLTDSCNIHNIKSNQLVIDVKTRWNSTYSMISRALELKVPLTSMCCVDNDLKKYILEGEEWMILESVSTLLENFDRATKHISMSRHPTISSVIPMYDWLTSKLSDYIKTNKTILKGAATEAHQKLLQYKPKLNTEPTLFAAVVLRPSLKLRYFQEHPEIYDNRTIKSIKELAIKMFEAYEPQNSEEPSGPADLDDEFLNHMNKRSRKESRQTEMQRYLSSPLAATKTDTLDWWKAHEPEYPNVAKMTRDIMGAQSTSVPIERQFSGGRDLIVPSRSSLKPGTITATMCLKSWWEEDDASKK